MTVRNRKKLTLLTTIAVAALVAIAIAVPAAAPCQPNTQIHMTVLCVGNMTEEHATAILDGLPADLWTFDVTTAQGEGVDWRHARDVFTFDPSYGDLPTATGNATLVLADRADWPDPGCCDGFALEWTYSASAYYCGNDTRFRQVVLHELLHCEPGVTVWHTADELAADLVYGVFAAECHPTGDVLERSNAYGVWQARHARTTDCNQEYMT